MRVRFTTDAANDLEEIGDWIAKSSPIRAVTYVLELRDVCSELSSHPHRFERLARFDLREIRRRVYGNHLIIYEIGGDEVTIVRIVHGSMDLNPLLDEL